MKQPDKGNQRRIAAIQGAQRARRAAKAARRRSATDSLRSGDLLQLAAEQRAPLDPAGCEGCREVAAFLALPGYPGSDHPPVH